MTTSLTDVGPSDNVKPVNAAIKIIRAAPSSEVHTWQTPWHVLAPGLLRRSANWTFA
jgi:hypothetical protein